jgi:prepilin-type N-terminal cleavage/methylation domain-containing protein
MTENRMVVDLRTNAPVHQRSRQKNKKLWAMGYGLWAKEGFTLLEIIIALVILAIGLIAIAYMVNAAISSNREAKLLTQAVILAQDKLEELKGVAYDNLAGGSDISGDYSRVWTVQTDTSKAMKTVTLTVSWNSGAKSVTFVTKIAQ